MLNWGVEGFVLSGLGGGYSAVVSQLETTAGVCSGVGLAMRRCVVFVLAWVWPKDAAKDAPWRGFCVQTL